MNDHADECEYSSSYSSWSCQMPDLLKAVHGSKDGMDKLVLAFHESHASFPKAQIKKRIQDAACKLRGGESYSVELSGAVSSGPTHGSARWIVHAEKWAAHVHDVPVCLILLNHHHCCELLSH